MKTGRPIVTVIDCVPDEDSPFWESYWYHQYLYWGFTLTNGHTHFGDPTSHPTTPMRKVVMDDVVTFISIHEASRSTKSDPSHIIKACEGKIKTHNKHTWKYLSLEEELEKENLPF